MIHVGFTGTQVGMNDVQKKNVAFILDRWTDGVAHHGDCEGADFDFHQIACRVGYKTHGHPPSNPSKRAFCQFDFIEPAKPYLERNHDIVKAVSIMLATPVGMTMVLRSGTWATIRYAREVSRPLAIVFINDSVAFERWPA